MVTVCKLGGSVITEKDRAETLDGPALDRAADAIADAVNATAGTDGAETTDAPADLVIVHGGGSFGHHHAGRHGVSNESGTGDAGAAVEIHGAMTTLNRFVLKRLQDRDVPAVPVHPLSLAHRDASGGLTLPAGGVEALLDEGFVPVLHGDVVPHAGAGVTVLSGDEIVAHLADALGADRVGLCSTVPGVLDADEEVIDRIEEYGAVADALGDSAATDVTGGMAGKVRALLAMDAPAWVFDLDGLGAFLGGESPGTRID
ncbi:MAG: isopentenyl phosphate kinase [Halobacteriales archaeon]